MFPDHMHLAAVDCRVPDGLRNLMYTGTDRGFNGRRLHKRVWALPVHSFNPRSAPASLHPAYHTEMNFASGVRLARGLDRDKHASISCLARRAGVPHLPGRLPSSHRSRAVATNPPLSSTKVCTTTTFSSPSRPRPVHPRPLPKRDLPVVKVR
jgi:hypothetical protein